jgi:hypothetical protein
MIQQTAETVWRERISEKYDFLMQWQSFESVPEISLPPCKLPTCSDTTSPPSLPSSLSSQAVSSYTVQIIMLKFLLKLENASEVGLVPQYLIKGVIWKRNS